MLKYAAIAALLLSTCLQAAAQLPSASDYNLGVDAYRARDYAAARLHWQKAVEQENVDAHNNLGYLLFNGLGGDKDRVRAVSLWQTASIARMLAMIPEARRRQADDLAASYIDRFSAGRAGN
jgi:TPR repeat protein